MVPVAVPIPMPIPRTLREHVFVPVGSETIVSISKLASAISLVPHGCGGRVSVIREPWEPVSLVDSCSREWTGPGVRYPTWIHIWAAKESRPGRTHCTGRIALARINRTPAEAAGRHGMH